MVQPAIDQPPSPQIDDLGDRNFFIPGRMRYPTPLRVLPPCHVPSGMDASPNEPAAKPIRVRKPRQRLSLEHELGEVDDGMAAMLQMVSGTAVAMAVDAVAGSNSADTDSVSGTPGDVLVEIGDDGCATVLVDVDVTDAEAGTKKTVTVTVAREEEGGLPITVVTDIVDSQTEATLGSATEVGEEPVAQTTVDSEPKAPETTAVVLPDDEGLDEEGQARQRASGRPGLAAPGPPKLLPTSIASSTDLPPQVTRDPRDRGVPTLDGIQDTTTNNNGDVESQRNDSYQLDGPGRGKRVEFFSRHLYAQDLLYGLVRATYVTRTLLVLMLFAQIPITLAVFITWALVPKLPPKTAHSSHNNSDTFGLEFVFLIISLIGYMLVLIGRATPRLKEGTLDGVRGYSRLLRRGGRLEKDLGVGFRADVLVEAAIAAAFLIVLVMKAVVLNPERGPAAGTCLRPGLVAPVGETSLLGAHSVGEGAVVASAAATSTAAIDLAEWAWGSLTCKRLVATVALLTWEV
ncbi:MAG: hypothetical protein M1813_004509 [Trichoglossum hirsutum]|nr:MAG: hypothetical protein M1813_004509 [Trichoglossum hirsutum]